VCGTSTRRLLGGPEGASEVTARGSYHAARAREQREALHSVARQHGLTEPALPIELAGERFFERAWTRSKEAGARSRGDAGLDERLRDDFARDEAPSFR
jgi:hypothetical protein